MDESLRKAIIQLQTQQVEGSRQLQAVRAQLTNRERDKKLSTLTLNEIEQLPRDSNQAGLYRGVGKMFMQESRNNVENTLRAKVKEATEEAAVLEKKGKYLENQIITAQSSLRDILQENAASR
ncbi:hypothetical protein JCM8547_003078 [Rhodosporidiobolus lusitaniae]